MKNVLDYQEFYRERLSKGIRKTDVYECVYYAQGKEDSPAKEALYKLIFDTDKRIANNAAWVFCNFDLHSNEWLHLKHDELIDEAIRTADGTKRRLMLQLLLRQLFDKDSLRTDFLDFCLESITSNKESTSVRTLSIKLAYEQCKYYPDLLRELQQALEMLEPDLLPTRVRTVRRKTLAEIDKALIQET